MRKVSINFVFILILLFCLGCNRAYSRNYASDCNLYEFVLGKWRAERTKTYVYGDYQEELFVKFINSRKLKFCSKNDINQICANFMYEKIDDNTILVENRRAKGGHWELKRENENLIICIWNDEDCIKFSRDISKFNIPLEVFNIYR